MKPDLYPLKERILLFRNELGDYLGFRENNASILDQDESIKSWEKDEAYAWLFFETHYLFFWGISNNTKKESLRKDLPQSLLANAMIYYSKWVNKKVKKNGHEVTEPRFKETPRYVRYGIPEPNSSESLIGYINRLISLVSPATYEKQIWEKSLGSFLDWIRSDIAPECHGAIDVIFPEDRTFYFGTVIRLSRKDKFPTNIVFASQVLKYLTEEVLWGDPRTQHCSAEALAFAWICLTSARLQLPTQIKLLHAFNGSSLVVEDRSENGIFPRRYLINVPTLFGGIPMEISKCLFDYLSCLSKINKQIGVKNSFFKSTPKGLRGPLEKAVKKMNLPPNHGDLTFTTLTSWPTENLNHRTQIDNSRYLSNLEKP